MMVDRARIVMQLLAAEPGSRENLSPALRRRHYSAV